MRRRSGLCCLCLVLLASCRKPLERTPADEAGARLVALVAREGNPGPQIIYRFSQPLQPGATITTGPDASPRTIARPSWLFYVDDDPFAEWSHAGRIFLYASSGDNVDIQNVGGYPEIQGASGEWVIVESQLARDKQAAAQQLDPVSAAQLLRLPGDRDHYSDRIPCKDLAPAAKTSACKKYALLVKGASKTPPFEAGATPAEKDISENVANVQSALATHGFETTVAASANDLKDQVETLAAKVKCCDEVILYYSGQGARSESAFPSANEPYPADHVARRAHYLVLDKPISGTELRESLGKLKTCHLQVVIDASYSGGFINALGQLPGLESFRASSRFDEPSYAGGVDRVLLSNGLTVTDPYGRAQGGLGSEFTSGFVKGLKAAPPDASSADLVHQAFEEAIQNDVTAIAGQKDSGLVPRKYETHPPGITRIVKCDCDARRPPQFGAPLCAPH